MNAAISATVDPNVTGIECTFGTSLREVSIAPALALALAIVTAARAQAQTNGAAQPAALTFSTLHSFTGGGSDGAFPFAAVIQDANGNLYGTAAFGGAGNSGTVYELKTMNKGGMTMWMYIPLCEFQCGPDGANPYEGLVIGASGNLYRV